MVTIDELRARKRELLARKKHEIELQEQGKGDNMALFMLNEELLDVNAQLRVLAPAVKRTRVGRKGALSMDAKGNVGDHQQFIEWIRRDADDDAEEALEDARSEMKRMITLGLNSITGRQREVLLLYADGVTQADIARKFGVNRSTVSRTLSCALKRVSYLADAQQKIMQFRDENKLDVGNPEVAKILMDTLTTHQAICFYLYYAEYLTYRQISDLIHIDTGSICRTVQRAVTRINDVLGGTVDILDNIEGLDDVVFAIYCGMKDSDLPPIETNRYVPKAPTTSRGKCARADFVTPPSFSINSVFERYRGNIELDQHGRLFQALYARFQNFVELDDHSSWTHPIARWLVKVFATITRRHYLRGLAAKDE